MSSNSGDKRTYASAKAELTCVFLGVFEHPKVKHILKAVEVSAKS